MIRASAGLLFVLLAMPALACQVERRADLPVSLADGFIEVAALVNGAPARFLLDTGAADLLVTPEAAARFALAPDPSRRTLLLGTGGDSPAPNAWLTGLRLGDAAIARRSVPVAPLPAPLTADGLLGAALLAAYDLDLDLVQGKVRLLQVTDCTAGTPFLPLPFTSVTLTVAPDGLLTIPVAVNGVPLTARLDTGSRDTSLTPAAAERVRARMLPQGSTTRGVDGEIVPFRVAKVATLAVGGDVQRDMQVGVAPLRIEGADMLLGVDWLRQRRVWVSYATGQVLIALHHAWR